MSYQVTYLSDMGDLCYRTLWAWHAAAAERTASQLWGGSFHTAQEQTS